MKHTRALIFFVVVAAAFVQAPAQTAVVKRQPADGLERMVYKKLVRLPYYGVFDHLTYKIEDGTVTLYGKVANARVRRDAERAVKNVEGVREVVNRVEALPPSPFDDRIRRRVLRTLAARGLFRYLQEPNPSVRLIVDGGRLELEGVVANRGDYNLIDVLAKGVSDVFGVTNNLIIEKESN